MVDAFLKNVLGFDISPLIFGYWFLGDNILCTIMLGFSFLGSLSPNLCDLCIFELIFQFFFPCFCYLNFVYMIHE